MNGRTQILAVVAVVVMIAAAFVGVGYAYQASYTDQATAAGSTTASYFKVAEGTDTAPSTLDALPTSTGSYVLVTGISTNQTGAAAASHQWLAKNGSESTSDVKIFTGSTAGSAFKAYNISGLTNDTASDSMTVKLYFYAGEYVVSAPDSLTQKSTISVTAEHGAAASGVAPSSIKYSVGAYNASITATSAEALTYSESGSATVTMTAAASTYSAAVYVEVTYIVAASTMGSALTPAAVTLDLPTLKITVAAAPAAA